MLPYTSKKLCMNKNKYCSHYGPFLKIGKWFKFALMRENVYFLEFLM